MSGKCTCVASLGLRALDKTYVHVLHCETRVRQCHTKPDGTLTVAPVTGVRIPLETREKVDHVAQEQGLGSRSEAILFLVALGLMALPYLLNPTTVKEAARKVEREAKILQRKGRAKR